jgi:hypothetical protein
MSADCNKSSADPEGKMQKIEFNLTDNAAEMLREVLGPIHGKRKSLTRLIQIELEAVRRRRLGDRQAQAGEMFLYDANGRYRNVIRAATRDEELVEIDERGNVVPVK